METSLTSQWLDANQHYLSDAVARVRDILRRHAERDGAAEAVFPDDVDVRAPPLAPLSPPAALDRLAHAFGLTSFERDVLVLCAGAELDVSIPNLCARVQGDPLRAYPTFSLALATMPDGHWSAIAPNAPLRRWRLIEFATNAGISFSQLRIDERILNYLVGVQHVDERLASLVRIVAVSHDLVPSHQRVCEQAADAWSDLSSPDLPILHLRGTDSAAMSSIAVAACQRLGLTLYAIADDVIPTSAVDLDQFLRLWERESVLSGSALLVTATGQGRDDRARAGALPRLCERMRAPLIVAGSERVEAVHRSVVVLDVPKPERAEQIAIWRQALHSAGPRLNGEIEQVAAQFNLDPRAISAASAEVQSRLGRTPDGVVGPLLWDASRVQARPALDDLAQRIDPAAGWDDLVLPDAQRQTLREIAIHVRQRATVYERWGFASKGARGLGISALFTGPSGTGKTMAAEVLAGEFRLDLYRIDLSSVVSKYIGETEKNLRQVFDAAESGAAILLFDEADALFGKRSEVKDSHDRYANIEVGYLLQRMEAYRGLAILTTNLRHALDTAFLRRIRFIVQFPFPDAALRAEIWRRIFPPDTPTERLDIDALARLNVTGGTIRNIALNAAFLAADGGEPVTMAHLLQAARSEYAKLEKTLTDAEIEGWL
jgi:hypothetical protein